MCELDMHLELETEVQISASDFSPEAWKEDACVAILFSVLPFRSETATHPNLLGICKGTWLEFFVNRGVYQSISGWEP